MLKFLTALTQVSPYLHLAWGLGLIGAAFWQLSTNDAFTVVFIATLGTAMAYRELGLALAGLQSITRRQAAQDWPETTATVVDHRSYNYTSGSEDTEHSAVSITWAYSVGGRSLETHTDVHPSGKDTPATLAKAHVPIGTTARVRADPAGIHGVVLVEQDELPSRHERFTDFLGTLLRTLLYLAYLGFTVWMVFRYWVTNE